MSVMEWWKQKNGILQIYPRSYKDSDNDGIGDLRGIIEKLSYIKGAPDSLGVDAIWLSPFYTSPMADFGYDIADYCAVDPMFGTLEDFKELIKEAHNRDIAIMIDLVPNHTSSDHAWFKNAVSSRTSEKRDYYIFRDGKAESPPNNWISIFGGSAWEFDEASGQYYLHSFLKQQPDLNWQNPAVQQEMRSIIRFWCKLGVDGFRADAVRWMGKDINFADDSINKNFILGADPYEALMHDNSRFSPELDAYLRILTSEVKKYEKRIILFEDYLDDTSPAQSQTQRLYSIDPTVSAPFNFQAIKSTYTAPDFAEMVREYEKLTPLESASIYCLGNHDKPRIISRAGYDLARVLAVIQMTLPGLPVIYYGEDIGMKDGVIARDKIRDPFEKRVPGKGLGRDPERTPMQWKDSRHAGFSDGDEPWLPVNGDYPEVNVERENKQPSSYLKLYQRLLHLRSEHAGLRNGRYQQAFVDDTLYMFWMIGLDGYYLVVANFSDNPRPISLPAGGIVLCSAKSVEPITNDPLRYTTIENYDALVISYKAKP